MQLINRTMEPTSHVVVEHGGVELKFNSGVFTRKNFDKGFDVFHEINYFWSQKSPQEQQQIFNIYREIYDIFDNTLSGEELVSLLKDRIVQLIRHHPLDGFLNWIWLSGAVQIPAGVEEEFVEQEDRKKTREKTYTRMDYLKLVSFCMFMRCLLPIWGEYIYSIKKESGVDYKEFIAFQLLIGTGILETEAAQKLRVYINQITQQKKMDWSKILNGVSSEDLWFWLMALVCVRRLCVGDIRGLEPNSHLVSEVYSFLYNKMFNTNESDESIKIKKFSGEGSGSGDEKRDRSILESYRKRTDLSIGEIETICVAMENIDVNAQFLAPGIDMNLVDRCIHSAQKLMTERLGDPQITLMSWVFGPIVSPYGVLYVPKSVKEYDAVNDTVCDNPVLIKAFGLLEAVLWHHGHHYLSIVSTSHHQVSDQSMVITPMDSRGQIPSELQEKLIALYPYVHGSLKRNTGMIQMDQNHVFQAIDLMVDGIVRSTWRSTAQEEHLMKVFGERRRSLPIRSSIKQDIARLVIDLGSRAWRKKQ